MVVICKQWQGSAYRSQKTAALPKFRAKEAVPFSRVGIDFAVPLFVKDLKSKGVHKVYIAIFSFCITRAIHLELVDDLLAETF